MPAAALAAPPQFNVTKTATPQSLPAPGGEFTYQVAVELPLVMGQANANFVSVEDSIYGNLLDPNNPNVTNNTCPTALTAGDPDLIYPETATCTFTARFTGNAGDAKTNVVTVTLENSANPAEESTDSDEATVFLTTPAPTPNPPNPPGPNPTCAGEQVTKVGTKGADTIHGTQGRDVIKALGGNDLVYGLRGGDIVCGGGGDDDLRGNRGADLLRGGRGADILRGGPGNDTCRGGTGNDAKRSC